MTGCKTPTGAADNPGRSGQVYFSARLGVHREGERTRAGRLTAGATRLLDSASPCNRPTPVRLELAGVLVAARRYGPALAMYEELERDLPNDPDVRTQIARLLFWDNRPGLALVKMEELLRLDFRRPDLWRMYVMAAASVKTMPAAQVELLARIADQPAEGLPDPAAHRARLAVALTREGNKAKDAHFVRLAQELLDRAISPLPESAVDRRELAGVLASAGRPKLALEAVRGLDLTDAALARFNPKRQRDMQSADREARATRMRPDDWEAKSRWRACSWGGKHGEAAGMYRGAGRNGRRTVYPAARPDGPLSGSHDDGCRP